MATPPLSMPKHDLEQHLISQGHFLHTLASQIAGDVHLGDDLLQDAWLRSTSAPKDAGHAWLRTVLRNLGLNMRRSRAARLRREQTVARAEGLPSAAEEAERAEYLGLVSNAVQALPDSYRAIVLLRYWDGLAPREIARLRGMPLATVKTQLQRGLGRLREQLGEEPPSRSRALAPFSFTLLMHTQTKLIGAAVVLALGALGLWGLPDRSEGTDHPQLEASLQRETDLVEIEEETEPELAVAAQAAAGRQAAGQELPTKGSTTGAMDATERFLTGRVLDDSGLPRSDARLVLRTLRLGESVQDFLCGEGGWYQGPALPAGAYTLEVHAPGCIPFRSGLTIAKDEPRELPDIVLRRGRELRGKVVDESGAGIAGAEVFLLEQPVAFEAVSLRPMTSTDADGFFVCNGLPQTEASLGILAKGWVPARVLASALQSEELVIHLARGWQARVRVLGSQACSKPLRLRALPATGSHLANDEMDWVVHTRQNWPLSGLDEQVCGGLMPGQSYYMSLEEQRHGETWTPCGDVVLVNAAQPDVVLTYRARAVLLVQTVDAVSGLALAAELETRPPGRAWSRVTQAPRAESDPADTVRIEVEPDSPLELRTRAPGYSPVVSGPWSNAAGESVQVTVKLSPVDALILLLQDESDGHPLVGGRIYLDEGGSSVMRLGQPLGTSDRNGRARVHVKSGVDGQLLVTCEGYRKQRVELAGLSRATSTVVKLVPGATALIYLRDAEGQPVPGVAVVATRVHSEGSDLRRDVDQMRTLERSRPTTDIAGRVLFSGLAAGEYDFETAHRLIMGRRIMLGGSIAQVSVTGDGEHQPSVRLQLVAGEVVEAQLVVPARLPLAGTLMEDGAPLAGARLHWVDREVGLEQILGFMDLGTPRASSDAEGHFLLPSLASGKGTLVITHEERLFPFSLPLTLTREQPDLLVHLPVGVVHGRVRDAGGAAIEGASVRISLTGPEGGYGRGPKVMLVDMAGVYSMSDGVPPTFDALSLRDGRYEMHGIPPDYILQVEASAPGFSPTRSTLALRGSESRTLDFTLQAAGRVTVRLADSSGETPRNCLVSLEWKGDGELSDRSEFSGLRGSLLFDGLEPGTWGLSAESMENEAKSPGQQIQIVAGEHGTVTLTLE